MKFLEEQLAKLHPVTAKTIACILAVALVFSVGFMCGTVSNIHTSVDGDIIYDNIDKPNQQPQSDTQTDSSLQTSQPPSETVVPSDTNSASEEQPTDFVPTTKAEILDLFTKSANKIKTDAAKVTRNYEKRQHNEEYLDLPSVLES